MGRKDLIHFRCWYCSRKHSARWDCAGERHICNCGERYRIPRYSGGRSQDKSILDRVIEFVVYGGGGAVLGFCLGLVIRLRFIIIRFPGSTGSDILLFVAVLTIGGFLAGGLLGTLFGERGINWIGSLIRRVGDE